MNARDRQAIMDIPEKIKLIQKASGMTQEQIARAGRHFCVIEPLG